MGRPDIESFGQKVRDAQDRLSKIRGVGQSGTIRVEVDATGGLLSVSTAQEADIIAAYKVALASITDQVAAAMQAVNEDPLAQMLSSLIEASNVVKEAAHIEQEGADELAYEAMRRDPLGWRRGR